MNLDAKRAIPVDFGPVQGLCYGGRFVQFDKNERRLCGVKMAAEINHPYNVSIPTVDFSIPQVEDMREGMRTALLNVARGNDIYVGCMGGIGRTGLFMGVLCKLLIEHHGGSYSCVRGVYSDPVLMVRDIYMGHAIETEQQQDFVRNFDTEPLLKFIDYMQSKDFALSNWDLLPDEESVIAPPPTVEYVQVPAPVPSTFWAKVKFLFS